MIRAAASLSLGLAYMAAFALLFLHGSPRKLLMVFVPAGRMALSNYLAQSLIGVALYYGAGPASVPPASCRPSCSWAGAVRHPVGGQRLVAAALSLRTLRMAVAQRHLRQLASAASPGDRRQRAQRRMENPS